MRWTRLSFGHLALVLTLALTLALAAAPADAAQRRKPKPADAWAPAFSALVLDADSGRVLVSTQPDALRHPASLTKMMTLYLVFDALDAGTLTLDQRLPVSSRAAGQEPSKLGLRAGSTVSVEDAVLGLVTKSANDASVVLAEALGRSSEGFARMMTTKARALGMSSTVYRNPNGLPDSAQVTTARDQARLGLALMRDHPHWYPYFSTRTFRYGAATHGNHNRLLTRYPGTDGIKTGYIRASGFNLVASVQRDGRRLVGVIFGGTSGRQRDDRMIAMLDEAFAALQGTPRPAQPLLAQVGARPGPATARAARQVAAVAASPAPGLPVPRPAEIARAALPPLPVAAASEAEIDAVAAMIDEEPAEATAAGDIAALVSGGTAPVAAANTVAAPRQRPAMMAAVPPGLALPAQAPATSAAEEEAARQPLGSWAIQLGAFAGKSAAEAHIQNVRAQAPRLLAGTETRLEPGNNSGQLVWRARLAGFAEPSARAACRQLRTLQIACLPVAPDQLALAGQ
ncbi:serine hydrolase [Zavarzinia sp. CC-PAN008]|uniref:D-alanyl-D-alanine carboxypeptidase n=1 Tax=Zavarzinia sp. CC-PAN008 TaxID=3243332 RepID=UPI003F746F6E